MDFRSERGLRKPKNPLKINPHKMWLCQFSLFLRRVGEGEWGVLKKKKKKPEKSLKGEARV
jgi:hypothetical protein